MSNHTIQIKEVYQTSHLATREAAKEIVQQADSDDVFDFAGIQFTSSSFVDEFLTQIEDRNLDFNNVVTNLNPDLARLFQAVAKRRRSPVRA